MFRTSLLFCAFFMAFIDAARFPNPLNLGNVGLRSSTMVRQNAEFGEGIRDWFRNMRDRIFGKDTSNQSKPMTPFNLNSSPMTHFLKNSKESEQVMIQPMEFFVDVSSLHFNRGKDWGFRIGSWYIIRKSDNSDEWDDWKDFLESTSELDGANSAGENGADIRSPKTETASTNNKKSIDENEATDNTSVEILKPLM